MAIIQRPITELDAPAQIAPYEQDPQFGSDVIVVVLQALGLEHDELNPGASYRGLEDSLVNKG